MSPGPTASDPRTVSAFHATLLLEGLVALGLLVGLLFAWQRLRARQLAAARAGERPERRRPSPEAPARRFLRLAFGALWLLDGLLQAQPAMPTGLVRHVIEPTAEASSGFVRAVAAAGAAVWNQHPVTAAAAAVFIQLGIGLLLLVAPRGSWSRLAGAVSLGWALVVWIFGESFGAVFAPGASVLFGLPGAALFYAAAGAVIALPEASFAGARLGRLLLRAIGLLLLGMALLQAWPGRGFWRVGAANAISAMSRRMAAVAQPGAFSSLLRGFSSLAAAHGTLINLSFVVLLAACGVALLAPGRRLPGLGLGLLALFALVTWLLVQDLGFFGGLGTDPNSMPPLLALGVGGYLALRHPAVEPVGVPVFGRLSLESLGRAASEQPAFVLRAAAAAGACGIVLIGAVPMALATLRAATAPAATALPARAGPSLTGRPPPGRPGLPPPPRQRGGGGRGT